MKGNEKKIIESARKTFEIESAAISDLSRQIGDTFILAVKKIKGCRGRIVVAGIGKSALIAQKIVATFNSTGTPSLYMHAADAIHGDLGMIQKSDIVLCISKSGESAEIRLLVQLVRQMGNFLIAMTGNIESFLAKNSDCILNTTIKREACANNLAPTTSTTAQLAMGDALAVCLQQLKGFGPHDFAKIHPGGSIGKKLYLRTIDLARLHQKPSVNENDAIEKVIVAITTGRLGAVAVLNNKKQLKGIITDGDLRRMMEKKLSLKNLKASDIMNPNPKTTSHNELAVHALNQMRENNITQVVVLNKAEYCGMLHVHDLLREGLL